MVRERPEVTEDAALGGRLRLKQPRRGHRFGHDAVLLAAATAAKSGDHVVELGAGVGLAGLVVALRTPAVRITLVEIDPQLVALAEENARENGLIEGFRAVALDVTASARAFAAADLPPGSAQRIMMNPPFNDPRGQLSPDAARAVAHTASDLAAWVTAAARLLVAGGDLTLIWRADGLAEVLASLRRDFGGIIVAPIHPQPAAPAIRVVVAARKGSRTPVSLLPSFILNAGGRPTPEAERVLRDGAMLPGFAADGLSASE